MQKLLTFFFSKNISVYGIFNDQSFNGMLTNDITSFEQLGPNLLSYFSMNHFRWNHFCEMILVGSHSHERAMQFLFCDSNIAQESTKGADIHTGLSALLVKTFCAWHFILNTNILIWLTIPYQEPFVFSVSVLCYQIFTLKLKLQPNICLTYAISIVKWFLGLFILEFFFSTYF